MPASPARWNRQNSPAGKTNLMDASWSASAPRYPLKILVVNLPGSKSVARSSTKLTELSGNLLRLHRYFNDWL